MDQPLEHYDYKKTSLPLEMTDENREEISALIDFDDITQEQADEFLALLWDIACSATLIHFGLSPIQSIVGKRQVLTTDEEKISVQ